MEGEGVIEHTPEPWSVFNPESANPGIDGKGDPRYATVVIYGDKEDRCGIQGKYPLANARRIVACVNACAGMADPSAEIARLRAEVEANYKIIVEIQKRILYGPSHNMGSDLNAICSAALAATEKETP